MNAKNTTDRVRASLDKTKADLDFERRLQNDTYALAFAAEVRRQEYRLAVWSYWLTIKYTVRRLLCRLRKLPRRLLSAWEDLYP